MGSSFIDMETGEVLKEPEFVKLYIKEVCLMRGLNASQTLIFRFMLSNMNWHNEVAYGVHTKQRFLDYHSMKNQTFNNNVTALIESGLIARIGKGEFKVNPKYASKAEWSKVKKITWVTEYTEDGKSEKVDVEFKDSSYMGAATQPQPQPKVEPEPAPPPPKAKAKPKKPRTQPVVKPEGVSDEEWEEFKAIKKHKKQRLSAISLKTLENYAHDYGISLAECIKICVKEGWGTFKPEYMDRKVVGFGQRKGPKTIEDFMRENEASAARVLASGLLDDLP